MVWEILAGVMVILPNQHASRCLLGQFGGSRFDMFRGYLEVLVEVESILGCPWKLVTS